MKGLCLQKLLKELRDVFRLSLGKTGLEMHVITLTDDKLHAQSSYHLPEALK
jgi:hypothetical protein